MINYENFNLENEIRKINETEYSNENYFNWYSHKKIICQLYNLRPSKYLSARVYHSMYITDYEITKKAQKIKIPVLCARKSQVDYLLKKGRSKNQTFATGGLFPMYRRFKNIQQIENPKGTIAFPAHSSKRCQVQMAYDDYIKKLKELPEEFQPVDVCLHWCDIEIGVHKIFLENGIKVYTTGHCNDEDFCDNFYEILRHYKYATSNYTVNSSLFYAIEMGLNVFLYGIENEPIFDIIDKSNKKAVKFRLDTAKIQYDFCKERLPVYPNTKITDEAKDSIINIMGLDWQSPKEKVRRALLRQEWKNRLKNVFDVIFRKN